jgi:23S rRNA (adenine2503-C2)-methyltransferase
MVGGKAKVQDTSEVIQDVRGLFPEEIAALIENLGEKPFRARQIFQWLHQHHAENWDDMTSLSKPLRLKLQEALLLPSFAVVAQQRSRSDRTVKYLFGFPDGQGVESVLMWYHYGASICISSQVGCRMGCGFCASTLGGLVRNLSAGEMAQQVAAVHKLDIPAGERAHSLVIMGSGEPLENYDQVVRFMKILNHPEGLGMSYRRMTLSTCGLVPEIRQLAAENIPVNLSVSLHSADNTQRSEIMPINKVYPLEMLLGACRDYARISGRRITFEYALIRDVNDSEAQAVLLAEKVRDIHCHINLIPLNPVSERGYQRSGEEAVNKFLKVLTAKGIPATVRRELGADIDAACGQLRRRTAAAEKGSESEA